MDLSQLTHAKAKGASRPRYCSSAEGCSWVSLHVFASREQPIFSCKAHVFHIDPKTKRSWLPASSAAVSVSFFYDSSRALYRIISVEGTKVRAV